MRACVEKTTYFLDELITEGWCTSVPEILLNTPLVLNWNTLIVCIDIYAHLFVYANALSSSLSLYILMDSSVGFGVQHFSEKCLSLYYLRRWLVYSGESLCRISLSFFLWVDNIRMVHHRFLFSKHVRFWIQSFSFFLIGYLTKDRESILPYYFTYNWWDGEKRWVHDFPESTRAK